VYDATGKKVANGTITCDGGAGDIAINSADKIVYRTGFWNRKLPGALAASLCYSV
jgi:hypothetical protein